MDISEVAADIFRAHVGKLGKPGLEGATRHVQDELVETQGDHVVRQAAATPTAPNPKTSVRKLIGGRTSLWRPRRAAWNRAEGCARHFWGRREAPTALFLLFRR